MIKMVTCNICRQEKKLEEIQPSFRYVCKDCWNKVVITFGGSIVDKDLLY